jgi:hypothetical protein
MATRDDLLQMLRDLEEQIPELQREYPDAADFWPEFSPRADGIRWAAGVEHDEWVWECIDSMLRFHGLAMRPLPA